MKLRRKTICAQWLLSFQHKISLEPIVITDNDEPTTLQCGNKSKVEHTFDEDG